MNNYIYPDRPLTGVEFARNFPNFAIFSFGDDQVIFSLGSHSKFTPLEIKNQVIWAYEAWFRKEKKKDA